MTNRERVTAALDHRQPDKTPYSIGFTAASAARMAAYYKDPFFALKLGNSLSVLSTEPAGGWKSLDNCVVEDQWGVQWNRTVDKDIGVVCNRVVTRDNVAGLALPDASDPSRYQGYDEAIAAGPDEYWVANLGFSLYERAWTLAGMEEVLMGMAMDKPFVHALMDRVLEFNLAVIEEACSHNIDAMIFGDDWGQQHGLIMGIRSWREFIKPRIAQMYAAVRAHGKKVFIHSCGKVDELFPELIEIGLDVFNPFQPEVIDVFEAKRRYGKDLSFYGGISTQRTLPFGTVQQVKDEVRRLVDEVGKDGGLIAAPAHAIPPDAAEANIDAMIEVLRGQ